jgi:hypothetical protein
VPAFWAGVVLAVAVAAAPFLCGADTDAGKQAAARLLAAHGGMEPWAEAKAVAFIEHWDYYPNGKDLKVKVIVETETQRARLSVLETSATAAWDGQKAWMREWDFAVPPRFLVHLNYVLIHLPWLLNEPGSILGSVTRQRWWNGKTYAVLRVGLSERRGRYPLELKTVLLDPSSNRLAGCQYVVTYAGVLPPKIDHSPLLTALVEKFQKEDDLLVPERYTVYNPDRSLLVRCEIEDWDLEDEFDASKVEMPEDAVIDRSPPVRVVP